MKISIIGAGEIGEHLAGLFSTEKRDVILMDSDPEIIAKITSTYDLMAIKVH